MEELILDALAGGETVMLRRLAERTRLGDSATRRTVAKLEQAGRVELSKVKAANGHPAAAATLAKPKRQRRKPAELVSVAKIDVQLPADVTVTPSAIADVLRGIADSIEAEQ